MTPYVQFAAIAFSLLFGCGLTLPFISFRDRWRAHYGKRTLFNKSAHQIELLHAFILALVSVMLCADLLCEGRLSVAMQGVWAWNFLGVCLLCLAAAILSFLSLFASIQAARWLSTATCLVCVITLGSGLACTSHWLAGGGSFAPLAPIAAPFDVFVQVAGPHTARFLCILLYLLASSVALACLSALCWHFVCRLKIDYGRDFYTLILGRRAQLAWKVILMVIAAFVPLLFICPTVSQDWASFLLSCCGEFGIYLAYGLPLLIPVAALLCHGVSTHPIPVQRKSYAFLSLIALCAGISAVGMHI